SSPSSPDFVNDEAEKVKGRKPAGEEDNLIQWTIGDVSELNSSGKFCDVKIIEGLPWRILAETNGKGVNKHLSIFIYGNETGDSRRWSVDVHGVFTIEHPGEGEDLTKSFRRILNTACSNWGYSPFITWQKLNDVSEDQEKARIMHYVSDDDSITLKVRVHLSNIVGFRPDIRFNFSSEMKDLSDLILVIEDEKVHVSKQYLALFSPVFRAMFYQNFFEKDQEEIELQEVEYDIVIDRCEIFLIDSKKFTVAEKLLLSDQYRLFRLEDHCISTIKSAAEVKAIKASEEYKLLSDFAKVSLFEKMMKLIT
ncbi:hypothetical protein PENTCL1PPCAC_24809, partial [Pristionchus entomophagus]